MATIYFFERICACTCVCGVCMCAFCICVHMCMWRSEITLAVFINNSPLLLFQVLSLNLELPDSASHLASKLQGFSCLCLSRVGVTG